MNSNSFVNTLTQLDYFNYTKKENLEAAQSSIAKYFDMDGTLMVDFSDDAPYTSLDNRFYDCGDCESLFEEDGVPKLLQEMTALFASLKFNMEVQNDTYTNTQHTIVLNNREYLMAEGSILMHHETYVKYAEMVNNELLINHKNERIHLFSYDDNSYMVFLTKEQHDFLDTCLTVENRPLTVDEWIRQATAGFI